MKKEFNKERIKILFLSVLYLVLNTNLSHSQSNKLFKDDLNLKVQLSFDFKELYKNTDDSTFIKSKMIFSGDGLGEDTITTRVRVRGNFRKKICYFKPMRLEIRKKQSQNTI